MVGKKTQKLSHARKRGVTLKNLTKHDAKHNTRKGGEVDAGVDAVGEDGGGPKHRNCHPQVLGKTVSPNSCMTPLILEKIKKIYNHNHASNYSGKIVSTDAVGIYHELKKKHLCETERCMIKKALGNKHGHLYDQMMKEMEAPEHPDDWKKNPNEWLSNIDINLVMKQYEKTYPEFLFLGPTSINFDERASNGVGCVGNDICHLTLAKLMAMKPLKRKVGMVFNLSRNDQPGSHWVSLFLHLPDSGALHSGGVDIGGVDIGGVENGEGGLRRDAKMGLEKAKIKGCKALLDNKHSVSWNENTPYAFFFDSGGDDAPQEVLTMICRFYREWERMKPAGALSMQYDDNHRTKAEHQMGGTECGMYSLFFIITMLTGICGGKAALLNARRLKKREVCPKDFRLHGEQDKRDYFLSHGKWNHKRIPDRFMQEFRAIYFNAR
jgi:hypothetical protein